MDTSRKLEELEARVKQLSQELKTAQREIDHLYAMLKRDDGARRHTCLQVAECFAEAARKMKDEK